MLVNRNFSVSYNVFKRIFFWSIEIEIGFDLADKPFSKTLRGKEKMLATSIFSFYPKMFYIISRVNLKFSVSFIFLSANALNWTGLQLCCFNPFPNKSWFLRLCNTSLLKTLWEKEKLHVTSNFSFSHSVFYPFGKLSAIFVKLKIVVCKPFEFGRV